LAEAGVDVSLMVSLTVILSGIQPIGRGLGAQRTEGCAPEKRAVLVVLAAGSLARAVVNGSGRGLREADHQACAASSEQTRPPRRLLQP
jgi:hypothetical protein